MYHLKFIRENLEKNSRLVSFERIPTLVHL